MDTGLATANYFSSFQGSAFVDQCDWPLLALEQIGNSAHLNRLGSGIESGFQGVFYRIIHQTAI